MRRNDREVRGREPVRDVLPKPDEPGGAAQGPRQGLHLHAVPPAVLDVVADDHQVRPLRRRSLQDAQARMRSATPLR